MTTFRFGPFAFDRNHLCLSRDGLGLSLRPKAALILDQLLRHPGETVSKEQLLAAAWHGRPTQDQTLFQTISELRRALAPYECIITIPNVGYRFVSPHPTTRTKGGGRLLLAAALLVLALIPIARMIFTETDTINAAPALRAFTLGMNNLDNPLEAQRYFEMATRENSGFLEAQLMLAETLLTQGRNDEAGIAAQALLEQARRRNLHYVQAGAMDLLSRLSEASGHHTEAFDWARKAHRTAVAGGHACSALLADDRLLSLAPAVEYPSSPAGKGDRIFDHSLAEILPAVPPVMPDRDDTVAQCGELIPDQGRDRDDFSFLQPERQPAGLLQGRGLSLA